MTKTNRRCRRVDCELTHCVAGHHVREEESFCSACEAEARCLSCGEVHDASRISCEALAEIRDAECAAGWDPNP